MLKQASSTLGLPIISLTSRRKVGQVLGFVHNENSGKVLAILVKKRGFFSPAKIISTLDVLDIIGGYLVVESERTISPSGEIIRVRDSLRSDIKVLGNQVKTEGGQYLGKVTDFIFDVPGYNLDKLYIKGDFFSHLVSGEITLPASKIKKITPKAVIVSDDILKRERVKEARLVKAISP